MAVFKVGGTQLGSSAFSPPSARCSIKAQLVEEKVPHGAVVWWYLDWQDNMGGGTWTGKIIWAVPGCSAAAASSGNKSPGRLLRILTRIGIFDFKKDA